MPRLPHLIECVSEETAAVNPACGGRARLLWIFTGPINSLHTVIPHFHVFHCSFSFPVHLSIIAKLPSFPLSFLPFVHPRDLMAREGKKEESAVARGKGKASAASSSSVSKKKKVRGGPTENSGKWEASEITEDHLEELVSQGLLPPLDGRRLGGRPHPCWVRAGNPYNLPST